MNLRPPAVARVLVLAAMLASYGPAKIATAPAPRAITPLAKLPPEVRLRKLHLVRPDLIQYPIAYEVYC